MSKANLDDLLDLVKKGHVKEEVYREMVKLHEAPTSPVLSRHQRHLRPETPLAWIKEGWLFLRRASKDAWKRKYVFLAFDAVLWGAGPKVGGKLEKLALDADHATLRLLDETAAFEIVPVRKPLQFAADSEAEVKSWMQAVEQAVQVLKQAEQKDLPVLLNRPIRTDEEVARDQLAREAAFKNSTQRHALLNPALVQRPRGASQVPPPPECASSVLVLLREGQIVNNDSNSDLVIASLLAPLVTLTSDLPEARIENPSLEMTPILSTARKSFLKSLSASPKAVCVFDIDVDAMDVITLMASPIGQRRSLSGQRLVPSHSKSMPDIKEPFMAEIDLARQSADVPGVSMLPATEETSPIDEQTPSLEVPTPILEEKAEQIQVCDVKLIEQPKLAPNSPSQKQNPTLDQARVHRKTFLVALEQAKVMLESATERQNMLGKELRTAIDIEDKWSADSIRFRKEEKAAMEKIPRLMRIEMDAQAVEQEARAKVADAKNGSGTLQRLLGTNRSELNASPLTISHGRTIIALNNARMNLFNERKNNNKFEADRIKADVERRIARTRLSMAKSHWQRAGVEVKTLMEKIASTNDALAILDRDITQLEINGLSGHVVMIRPPSLREDVCVDFIHEG